MFLQNTVRDVRSVISYLMCSFFYVYIYNVTTRHVCILGRDLTAALVVDQPRHMSS
jgi:hypothetical protein